MSRRILPLVCLLLAGCFSLETKDNPYVITAPPAPSSIRTIPHTFALEMLSARQASSVTVNAFSTGKLKTRGEAVSSLKSYNAKVKLDIPVYLIKHSKEGYILFGSGLSTDEKRRPNTALKQVVKFLASFNYEFSYKQKKNRDIVSQLKKSGIEPKDIRWIIVPYWGPGTVGMLDHFPEATVVVSRREWEWHKEQEGGAPGPIAPSVFEGKVKLQLIDINNKPPFGAFENGVDLFKDSSLFLVNLPGRTPGNMGLWMNLDRGPALLTGGATFVVDNYLDLSLPVKGKLVDLEAYWLSLHIIKTMREGVPQLVVLPGNDLTPITLAHRDDITRTK